jgi:hypothetical protein
MRRLPLMFGLLALASCEAPPVYATQDPAQSTQLSHIDGSVVVQSVGRGNVVLFLFDVTRPPPPAGTGKPLSFTVVGQDDLFGADATDNTVEGPFTAPFSFSLVPPGSYFIQGFIDLNGCFPRVNCRSSSFIPWYNATNGPNSGDVGGAAADPVTLAPTVITVNAVTPTEGVSVGFVDANVFPIDRPAVSATCLANCTNDSEMMTMPPTPFAHLFTSAAGMPAVFELDPKVGLVAGNATLTAQLFAQYVSVVNGVPQDVDGNPANGPALWPQIVVRKVDSNNPLNDENVDSRGLPLPQDAGVDGGPVPEPQVVLAAGVYAPSVVPALTGPGGQVIATPVPVPNLQIAVLPEAFDATNPAQPVPLPSVPPGLYAVYVIQFTGQEWRVPNELGPAFAGVVGFTPSDASQGFFLSVP